MLCHPLDEAAVHSHLLVDEHTPPSPVHAEQCSLVTSCMVSLHVYPRHPAEWHAGSSCSHRSTHKMGQQHIRNE